MDTDLTGAGLIITVITGAILIGLADLIGVMHTTDPELIGGTSAAGNC